MIVNDIDRLWGARSQPTDKKIVPIQELDYGSYSGFSSEISASRSQTKSRDISKAASRNRFKYFNDTKKDSLKSDWVKPNDCPANPPTEKNVFNNEYIPYSKKFKENP